MLAGRTLWELQTCSAPLFSCSKCSRLLIARILKRRPLSCNDFQSKKKGTEADLHGRLPCDTASRQTNPPLEISAIGFVTRNSFYAFKKQFATSENCLLSLKVRFPTNNWYLPQLKQYHKQQAKELNIHISLLFFSTLLLHVLHAGFVLRLHTLLQHTVQEVSPCAAPRVSC